MPVTDVTRDPATLTISFTAEFDAVPNRAPVASTAAATFRRVKHTATGNPNIMSVIPL